MLHILSEELVYSLNKEGTLIENAFHPPQCSYKTNIAFLPVLAYEGGCIFLSQFLVHVHLL